MNWHTGGKWLIHGTKHHKYNQLQNLGPHKEYPSWKYKLDIEEPYGKGKPWGRQILSQELWGKHTGVSINIYLISPWHNLIYLKHSEVSYSCGYVHPA